jgi:hypothetical protein
MSDKSTNFINDNVNDVNDDDDDDNDNAELIENVDPKLICKHWIRSGDWSENLFS